MSAETYRALRAAAAKRDRAKVRWFSYRLGTRADYDAAEAEYRAARDAHAAEGLGPGPKEHEPWTADRIEAP